MRLLVLLSVILLLLTASCSGDKHLPSSNPPEYDPKKVYTAPAVPLSAPTMPIKQTQSSELERLQSKLDSIEADQKEKGEGKRVPFDPNLLPSFKGVTTPCEAMTKLAQGLGTGRLFEGHEGAALKKALGSDADGIAHRMDEHLTEGLKHSLGPAATDCPISVRPHKSSSLSQPARLVLARMSSTQPLLLAQTTIPDTSQNDYDVQKSLSKEAAPLDWVGYKSTETMTRIGNQGTHAEGVREAYEMIVAPKAKRCPDPEGMVEGIFEWSFVMMRATTGPQGEPHGVLYRRHVTAELKGKVEDDAQLKKVLKFDATVTLQHIGTELPYYSQPHRVQGEFSIDHGTGLPQELRIITVSGFSEGEAQIKDAQLLGTFTALMAYFSGQEYVAAQREWNKPNICVEITFTPATRTKKFNPNQSVSVKTELRTKREQATVPATFKEAKEKPREGNGDVSPKQAESIAGSPATFTYTMPGKRVKHSGFWVGAFSRAGVAETKDGEWELADSGLILRFSQRIMADPQSNKAKGGWAQFDGTVQFDILLEPYAEGWFRGEINLVRPMAVRHVKYGTCGSASRTEHWLVTAHVTSKNEFMDIRFGFTTSNEQGSWTCGGPRDELHDDLFAILETVNMPTRSGMKKDFNARNMEFLEWLNVEVVEGLDEQIH